MKIACLTERMLLGFGVDLVVHEQARRLQKLGNEVTVFTAKADGSTQRDYGFHVLSDLMPGFCDYTSDAAIREFMKSDLARSQDVWILHTPPFYQWIAQIEAPVVFMEHGSPPGHLFDQTTAYHLWKLTHDHFARDYGRLRRGDAILSISQYIHGTLPDPAKAYSTVLHHGADHYSKAHPGDRLRFRHKLGVKEDNVLILWVGRMQFAQDEQPYKGFGRLLELIPAIKGISRRVKIACLGKIEPDELHHFKGMDVIPLPSLSADLMGAAYAAADILLNLALWEGFNLALVESQFQGTPVVALDVGPHKEVTRKGQTALLVDDTDQLVPALARLVRNNDLRQQMGADAEKFAASLTWDRNVEELEALLARCQRDYREAAPPPRIGIRPSQWTPLVAISAPPLPEETNVGIRKIGEGEIDNILAQEDQLFIDKAYWTLLGRVPDAMGRQHYLDRLAKGNSRLSILRDIASGLECQRRNIEIPRRLVKPSRTGLLREVAGNWISELALEPVRQLDPILGLDGPAFVDATYALVLRREPDAPGAAHYLHMLRQTGDKISIIEDVRSSAEARALRPRNKMLPWALRYRKLRRFFGTPDAPPVMSLDDAAFVHEAYRLVLGREAEEGGLNYHVHRLRTTGDKRGILLDMYNSPEGSLRVGTNEALFNALKRYRTRQKPQFLALRQLLAPIFQQAERIKGLEHLLHRIDSQVSTVTNHSQLLVQHALDGPVDVPRKFSPPNPYHIELSPNYLCLHAPGAQLDEEAYARLEHIAEMTGADLVFGDEWVVIDNKERVPVLRTAISPYGFAEQPDLGGVVAVRRSVVEEAGLERDVALTGEVLLRLAAQVHSVVHHPTFFCQRQLSDVRSNAPSIAALAAYLDGLNATIRPGEEQDRPSSIVWANRSCPRALIIMFGTSDKMRMSELLDFPHSGGAGVQHLIKHVPRDADMAEINELVHAAPEDCELLLFLDGQLKSAERDWLEQLAGLALRDDVGMATALVLTSDNRIASAGWHLGPHGTIRPRARFRSFSRLRKDRESFIDPSNRLHEISAADLTCAAMRRATFVDLGGLDEGLKAAEAGIDLSIRLREMGLSILLNGHAVMTGIEPLISHTISDSTKSHIFFEKNEVTLNKVDPFSTINYDGTTADPLMHQQILDFKIEYYRIRYLNPRVLRINSANSIVRKEISLLNLDTEIFS